MANTGMDQPSSLSPAAQKRNFLLLLKIVLERAYQDGIQQFYGVTVAEGKITGRFRDGGNLFNFTLSNKNLAYSPAASKSKTLTEDALELPEVFSDSDAYALLQAQYPGIFLVKTARTDARPPKCGGVTTYRCGGMCLTNKKVCRINQRAIATPKEFKTLLRLGGGKLSSAVSAETPFVVAAAEAAPPGDGTILPGGEAATAPPPTQPAKPKPKTLDEMSIRELRVEAQRRGVPGYSHTNKETLKAMIQSWDKEPEDQRKIVKAIEESGKTAEG